jgi:hypothetical protein
VKCLAHRRTQDCDANCARWLWSARAVKAVPAFVVAVGDPGTLRNFATDAAVWFWTGSSTLQAALDSLGQIKRVTVSDTANITRMVSRPRSGKRKRSRHGKRTGSEKDKSAAEPSGLSITRSVANVVRKNDPCAKRSALSDLNHVRTATTMLAKEQLCRALWLFSFLSVRPATSSRACPLYLSAEVLFRAAAVDV